MGGSHGGCGEATPLRIEPQGGKVAEDAIKSSSKNEPWHILKKNNGRRGFVDDLRDGRPDPAFIVESLLGSGGAPRLAGESRSEAIHCAMPASRRKPLEFAAPNRSALQALFRHPRQEHGRTVGFPLNVSHHARPGHGGAHPFVEHAGAAAEAKDSESGGMSHTF